MTNSGIEIRTPLMKQYHSIKAKHPDAILLFRVGDFYETFGPDAIKTSGILGITLTRRANGTNASIELAGFPYHAIDTYLPKLVRAGQRVAICDQLEDPKLTKTIVKRGITELVTPGISFNDSILNNKENNFLACVYIENKIAGIALLDISTGEFITSEGSFDYIDKLLQSFNPKEVLVERSKSKVFSEVFGNKFYIFKLDDWAFTEESAYDRLIKHFETTSLKGFGIQNIRFGIIAAGAIIHYLDLTQHDKIQHITKISRLDEDKYVWLDKFTIRNLELIIPISEGGKTFIDIIDKTITPMGSRLIKRWVILPLKDVQNIKNRQNIIEYFLKNTENKAEIEKYIKLIGDLERIISKVAINKILPREVNQLKTALEAITPIKKICSESNEINLQKLAEQLNPCQLIKDKIANEITDDPPNLINKGNVIRKGISKELDELRDILYSGKDYLNKVQQREIEKTGISSLKISFNNVFGYYIEVRNTHKDKVPPEWIRKQTLVSAERYITEELKEYETKILGAEEKIIEIETKLFNELIISISDYISAIQLNASLIAKLDCLISFSIVAENNHYIRPEVNDSDIIDIKQGRHPVIEKYLPIGEKYVANDVYLDNEEQQIIIITGPNMVGKSALLRQVALITLMAQIGSYVPAQSAKLGIVDKIFTRVGASDNISSGESTFMIEMIESASIINNLSHKSLILLDEIGRGTSTYDGISIAWALVEYIHEHPASRAKTLFATHYHELNEMENSFKRVKNYNISVKELDNKVIFIRKFVRGGTEHSFGIHVARMAGMPKSLVNRAEQILQDLEKSHKKQSLTKPVADLAEHREGFQLSFFQLDDPVLKQIRDEIKNIDINNLTPMEALNKLNEIKKISGI